MTGSRSAADGVVLPGRVLVVGFARTGVAVAGVLRRRGVTVLAVDDDPSAATFATARRSAVELVAAPTPDELARLAGRAELVVVSPGVPPSHPIFAVAADVPVISEIELAGRLGGPEIIAITGTNGKTTVTSLVASMLSKSGRATRAAGNIGYPLVEAVDEPGLDVVVAEVSSFQLALTTSFRPSVGAWLNLAEDHLDWHRDLEEYADAKGRIWANQDARDVAVANAEDAVVLERARRSSARLVTFGERSGDFRGVSGRFLGPGDLEWASLSDLPRAMPHDVANSLAALAVASSAGGSPDACRAALREEVQLPHRVELVATIGGVRYVDDSKATTPSAVVAALAGFDSVVLLAGGRNKGLDLAAIASAASAGGARGRRVARLRGVVAIGEAAREVEVAFAGLAPVVGASTMHDAVAAARDLAEVGDAVLLSPGCASYDWYRSYEERGADFAREVRALVPLGTGRA